MARTIGNASGGEDTSSDGTEKIPVSGSKYMLVSTIAEYIRTLTQTLTNKTLTTPTIGDFSNATHAHTNNASGGTIAHTALTSIGTNTHAQIDTHISTGSHVTNGDSHDHSGGDGGTIAYSSLSGKRWLFPFGVYTHISPMSASDSTPYAGSIDRNFTLKKLTQGYVVLTTNNGSNYWEIKFQMIGSSGSAALVTINTSAGTTDIWQTATTSTFDTSSVTTTYSIIFVECDKVGAPGNLYLAGPALEIEV